MQIRPITSRDLDTLAEIDGTIESTRYLHLEQQASDEPSMIGWRLEERSARQKMIEPNRLNDELLFIARQIASGAEEGLALVAEHDDAGVALLLAQRQEPRGTLHIVDLRIDYEHRRQGVGLALMFQAINTARQLEVRAVSAETTTNNFAGIQLLRKLGFELSGVDTRRHSNHDVVKESATLFWYLPLD
jgi:ribosomal protein S18 acetylase RimI-like enzyme